MAIEFPGFLYYFNQQPLLVFGAEAAALGEPTFGPPVYLHPGYRFYTRETYLIPTAVIDDIGQRFAAPDCYRWLEEQGDLFPRSDVLGFLADGTPESVVVKELDLIEIGLFVAPSAAANQKAVQVEVAIDTTPVADGYALKSIPFPHALLDRAVSCYRLAPGTFGAVSAAILTQLLANHFRDWRLTFDELDDRLGGDL